MKKAELVDLLEKHENIGDLDREALEAMTVKVLESLKKEMDAELAEPEENATEPAAEPEENDTEPAVFRSMCGVPFDPAHNSSCRIQCKKDYPDSFKDCEENFKLAPSKGSKQKAKGLGMNQWYHRPGTQGGLMDDFFIEGKVGTAKEIAAFAGCNERRIMIHIKHLIADFGIEILAGTRKKKGEKAETIYFWKEKDKRRKGTVIPGKTGFPKGFPKNHPCSVA